MKYYLFLFIIILCNCKINSVNYFEIKKQLIEIYKKDQTNRIENNWLDQKKIDEENLKFVSKIIDSLGWLGKTQIGDTANDALFLVIQHSDKNTMEKYLPIMKKAVLENKAEKNELAMLIDRVEVNNNRPQIFGSQGKIINNKFVLDSIVDIKNIDTRRKEMNLIPINEYILGIKKMYNLK